MRILITGGAGFIGSHVADAYIADGHEVTVIDDLSTGRRENINPRAKFIQIDIRDAGIAPIFEEGRFDLVNHHAAQMDVRRSVEDPIFDAEINVLGGLNLLEQCRKHKVKRFIFASTGGAIYGEQDYFPADENHPTRPLSPYGITKLATEKYLQYYREVFGLEHVILRYANVFGPRQNPHGEAGVVAIFTSKLLRGEQPIINGDGKQTRDYVYVGDVVAANLAALMVERSDTFNIGTGIESNVNELFAHVRDLAGFQCEERHGPSKAGEQKRSVLEASKARRMLNWQPQLTFAEGLRETVQFFRSNS